MTIATILILFATCYFLDLILEEPKKAEPENWRDRIHMTLYHWLRGDRKDPKPH